MDKRDHLRRYLSRQIGYSSVIEQADQQQLPSRQLKQWLKQQVEAFLCGRPSERWIVIPGLRGVGKTTLMLQTYSWIYKHRPGGRPSDMIYISLDVVDNFGANLLDVIDVYESLLQSSLEANQRPVFIFLDEVQTDPKWANILKTVYDRASNVFMVCSGSAATYIQMGANTVGRRASIRRLYPLSFGEYQMIFANKAPIKGLKGELIDACYHSKNAPEVFEKLKSQAARLDRAWARYDAKTVNHYLELGTLPFAHGRAGADVHRSLLENVEKIIYNDLVVDRRFNFSQASMRLIRRLINLLAISNTMPSMKTMTSGLETNSRQVLEMLEALAKAEILIMLPAHGSAYTKSRLPASYHFMSSALRYVHCNIAGYSATSESRRGRLLKDVAALHYQKEFVSIYRGELTYIFSRKDANVCDFILRISPGSQIAIEFGSGAKSDQQVKRTMNKLKCNYGLTFSRTPLKLDKGNNTVMIPLAYFFMM